MKIAPKKRPVSPQPSCSKKNEEDNPVSVSVFSRLGPKEEQLPFATSTLEIPLQPSSQVERAEVESYIAKLLAKQDKIQTQKTEKIKELEAINDAEA